ncbi:MAG TPA: HD domain-containing phosphohydrolase [Spirochaetia bacterium]|nr:HD domain-containing phosphohydrolase [Spirochaetia bacterium]
MVTGTLDRLLGLFKQLDGEESYAHRMKALIEWCERIPDVHSTRLVYFDSPDGEKPLEFSYLLPSRHAAVLPKEPAVLNGKSPIPTSIFPVELQKEVTLFYPLKNSQGELSGALLLKCESPRRFLKQNELLLGFLASKAQDLSSVRSLQKETQNLRSRNPRSEQVTPQMLGGLMDTLAIPMYVIDPTGRFLAVNSEFLLTFAYSSLEELNREGTFFVGDNQWLEGIDQLFREGNRTINVQIRTGRGETRTVQNASTLIGRTTLGVLFDVSNYLRLNEELQETLERHRILNEKLQATTSVLQKTQSTAMKSLAALAEYRDLETGKHLHRMSEYCGTLVSEVYQHQPYKFNIGEEYIDDMYLSAMLHDIGKVGVPDGILLKEQTLTPQEWTVMKKHTVWGWNILNDADMELGKQSFLTLSSRIALNHHERWDGTGYPQGIHGSEIPLSARITTIADVYDALTSKRPYKEPWSHERAIEEIKDRRESHFDPALVDLFIGVQDKFREIRTRYPE